MKQFEIGKEYTCHSIGDWDVTWTFKVTARTAKTITVTDGKETKKLRIIGKLSAWEDRETVYPLGNYSMCPVLRA